MATLYVENVPDEIYKALRKRARANRKSIASEVISLLQQNIPTEDELKRRRQSLCRIGTAPSEAATHPGPVSVGRGDDP